MRKYLLATFCGFLGSMISFGVLGQVVHVGGNVPVGGIILVDGGCVGGFTEYTRARGRYLVGVPDGGTLGTLGTALADLADVSFTPAGTNGTVSFTPTGTNGAPSFTGTALGTHTHETPLGVLGDNVTLKIDAAFGPGVSRSLAYRGTVSLATDTIATLLTNGTSAGTPSGTVAAPPFTGTAGTVPAQVFAGTVNTTMRSTIAPPIQLRLCVR